MLRANKLSLNIAKTHFLTIHPPQKNISNSLNIEIDDKTVNQQKGFKYRIGILVDCHLNWKEQIQQILKKISGSIVLLSKIKHFVDMKTLDSIIPYAIVLPFLSYGCIVLGQHL